MAKKQRFGMPSETFEQVNGETDFFLDYVEPDTSAQKTISIQDIKILPGRRAVSADKVKDLVKSIKEVGLINPITLTHDNTLIAGAHRVQAFKDMGLMEIPYTYLEKGDSLLIELAEIDENLVRGELHFLEQGRVLERRKEIYEELYPETKHGGDRKSEDFKTNQIRLDSELAVPEPESENIKTNQIRLDNIPAMPEPAVTEPKPSFADDTATKTGFTPRKIQQDIQISRDLTDKAKKAIMEYNATKKEALQLSRMNPEKQNEIADRSAETGTITGAIRAVNRAAVKQLPSLDQLKRESETEGEKQLRLKKEQAIKRVIQTAEYLKRLNEKNYQRDEIKGSVRIYRDKRGEYSFHGETLPGRMESDYYAIPDGYVMYMCAGAGLIILNEHSLICHLGTDIERDKPVIIDGAVPDAEDGVVVEFIKSDRK